MQTKVVDVEKIGEFKNDMCFCNRDKPEAKQVGSCCVNTSTGKVCEHFDEDLKYCRIKSIT